MVCLDTNFIIDLIRRDPQTYSKLRKLGGTLCTTTISLAELYKGAYLTNNVNKEIRKIESIIQYIRIITLDQKSSKLYGQLYEQLKSNRLKEADLLIASIAISNNETLLTRDQHFQRISTLRTDTW